MSIFSATGDALAGGLSWGLFRDAVEIFTYTIGDNTYNVPSVGIFDQILQAIVETCIGKGDMAGTALGRSIDASALFYSKGLFYYLGMMDFVIAIILGLIAFENGPNFLSLFMNKIFKYGFWMFVFLHWRDLITRIGTSFLQIGVYDRDVDGLKFMMHPSDQITTGFNYAIEYIKFIVLHEGLFTDRVVLNVCIALLAGLFIFVSFFLIALNLFLTVAEFYICSALMLVFIPFALFDKTERFASQTFNLVICFGVRLMILGALIRMGSDFLGPNSKIMDFFVYKDAPHLIQTFLVLGLVFTYAYLCCEAPQMASSVISGALNLNSNNAVMHGYGAMAFTSGVVGGAAKAGGAVVGATQRSIDAAKAANGGVIGKSLAAVGGFSDGISSGIAKGTIGGLEEGQAVYQAASGRTTGHESSTSPGYQVTRDADGNIIRKSGSSDNSGGFTSNHGMANKINDFVMGSSSGGNPSSKSTRSASSNNNSYVYAPTTAPNKGSSPGVSQEGRRGPQGDFGHQ